MNNNAKITNAVLDDEQIIDLYWQRNEQAISETDKKYKRYLFVIAYNILHDYPDCEECLNDTYLGAWNSMPPARPTLLQLFLSKITRNTAVEKYKHAKAAKRIPTEMTTSLDELEQCISGNISVEEEYFATELGRVISNYLRSLSEDDEFIFFCRYYCSDKISDIALMLHKNERSIYRRLTTLREDLKKILIKEGYYNE